MKKLTSVFRFGFFCFILFFLQINPCAAQDQPTLSKVERNRLTDSILHKKRIFNYLVFSGGISGGWYSGVTSTTCIANGHHQAGIGLGYQYNNVTTSNSGVGDSINISLGQINISISNRYFFAQAGRGAYFELAGGINVPVAGKYTTHTGLIREVIMPVSLFKNSASFGLSLGTRITSFGESALIAEVQYRYNPLPLSIYELYSVHQVGFAVGASF